MERSSAPSSMPWNPALSSALRAIAVRTTRNGTPDASSASIAGVVGWSVMRSAYDLGMTEATPTPTPDSPPEHRPTLMTVHAHPDDETIGTGGSMAVAVRAGRRVVLVTCTRGEMGEIVVPEMDTPENHRRLGEIRAGELERAMDALGVTEWENLGYKDSDMMGRAGNRDARCFWQADIDEAIGRLVFLVRTYQPDVMTTYNEFGGYGHPDHIRTHLVGGRRLRARGRSVVVPGAAGARARRDRGGRRRGRAGAVGPGQALRAGDPGLGPQGPRGPHGGDRRAVLLVAAAGRHARADRGVRGVRGARCSCPTSRSPPGSTSRR